MNRFQLTLSLLILGACTSQFQMAKPHLDLGTYANPEENSFYQLINAFRAQLQLSPLMQDARLNEAARKHSEWMMGMGVLTHAGPTATGSSYMRVIYEGVDADALVGENIARGNFSARDTFLQWLLSPAHLNGMIEPRYDHIGVSRSECDEDNTWYCFWTTDFAQLNEGSGVAEREPTVEDVRRAAEAVLGPLGDARGEISLDEGTAPQSRWQRIKNRFKLPGELY